MDYRSEPASEDPNELLAHYGLAIRRGRSGPATQLRDVSS